MKLVLREHKGLFFEAISEKSLIGLNPQQAYRATEYINRMALILAETEKKIKEMEKERGKS